MTIKTARLHNKKYSLILFLLIFFVSCSERITYPPAGERDLVILYTNDEHGWMLPEGDSGGAAEMMTLWRENEKYTEDGPFLILSGGDMWTGPAISTWFKGRSMAAVMNKMNYAAAAIGNHEFDFKVKELRKRLGESSFPFLSANIRKKTGGAVPDFAVPYLIKEINGIQVGLIGLTTTSTPVTAFPENVADYDFISYEEALREYVPKAESGGAELLVIVGHICENEIQALIPLAKELGIDVIGGGHCHERFAYLAEGIAVVESGSFLEAYAKIEIEYDKTEKKIISIIPSVHNNEGASPDAEVGAVVAYWEEQVNSELSRVIGYTDREIYRNSNELNNLVTDSWLVSFSNADVSLTNAGGIRQSIPRGDITLATIVGLLPFENSILELQLTGSQLKDASDGLLMGGMTAVDGYYLTDGTPLYPDSVYSVLTTDYLYSLPDLPFQEYDPEPYNTGINYRQPLIDRLEELGTSAADPLTNYLDSNPRR